MKSRTYSHALALQLFLLVEASICCIFELIDCQWFLVCIGIGYWLIQKRKRMGGEFVLETCHKHKLKRQENNNNIMNVFLSGERIQRRSKTNALRLGGKS